MCDRVPCPLKQKLKRGPGVEATIVLVVTPNLFDFSAPGKHIFSIDDTYYTSNSGIGGSGGTIFYHGVQPNKGPDSGTVVRSLQAWHYTDRVVSIKVGLTNGSVKQFGTTAHESGLIESDVFFIDDGEKIISLSIWGTSYGGGRCKGFKLTTDQKRSMTINLQVDDPYTYEPQIGSGILVGVFGTTHEDLVCIGFALLHRASAQLIGVEYPDISKLLVTTSPREIKSIVYNNSEGTVEQQFTFDGSVTVTTEESWSITVGMESSIDVEVTAGIPIIDEVKVKVSLKISASNTYKRTSTETTQQSFSFPVEVPAGKNVQASAAIYEGNIKTKYVGKMVYTLDSGKTFSYNTTGDYYGIAASEAVVSVKEY